MRFTRLFLLGWLLTTWLTLPAMPAPARPNVLFIYTDQQQFGLMSADGHPTVQTPAMDRIARSGARFTHAFCVTPQCSPSRAATISGRYPHQVNMMGNLGNPSPPLDSSLPTIGNVFRSAGYATAYFGKWHLGGHLKNFGFAEHDQKLRGEKLAERVATYLTEHKKHKPFFAFASFVNPHDVYHHPKKGKRPFDTTRIKLPASLTDDLSDKPWPHRHFLHHDQGRAAAGFDTDDWKQYIAHYHSLVEAVDRHVGTILQALNDANLRDKTIVILTSDHGDSAGAHGLPFKYPAMYEELIRVPLLISYPPKIKRNVTINELVTHLDLLPTLCALTDVHPPAGLMGELMGESLVPLLRGRCDTWRDAVFGEYYGKQKWMAPIRMVRTARWKYCLYQRHGAELYDLKNDPHELHNLAHQSDLTPIKQRLHERLNRWMTETNDPFSTLAATDRQGTPLLPDWKPIHRESSAAH